MRNRSEIYKNTSKLTLTFAIQLYKSGMELDRALVLAYIGTTSVKASLKSLGVDNIDKLKTSGKTLLSEMMVAPEHKLKQLLEEGHTRLMAENNNDYWAVCSLLQQEKRNIGESLRMHYIAELFDKSFNKGIAIAYNYFENIEDAYDEVGNAFQKLMYKDFDQFFEIKNLESYFLTIVRNSSKNEAIRTNKFRPFDEGAYTWQRPGYLIHENEVLNEFLEEDISIKKNGELPSLSKDKSDRQLSSLFSDRRFSAKVEAVLNNLKEEDAGLLRFFYLEGLSHDEIARRLDISVPTSRVKLHRARARFKELYRPPFRPDDDPGSGNARPPKNSGKPARKRRPFNNGQNSGDGIVNNFISYVDCATLESPPEISVVDDKPFHNLIVNDRDIEFEIIDGNQKLLRDYGDEVRVKIVLDKMKEKMKIEIFRKADLELPLSDIMNDAEFEEIKIDNEKDECENRRSVEAGSFFREMKAFWELRYFYAFSLKENDSPVDSLPKLNIILGITLVSNVRETDWVETIKENLPIVTITFTRYLPLTDNLVQEGGKKPAPNIFCKKSHPEIPDNDLCRLRHYQYEIIATTQKLKNEKEIIKESCDLIGWLHEPGKEYNSAFLFIIPDCGTLSNTSFECYFKTTQDTYYGYNRADRRGVAK